MLLLFALESNLFPATLEPHERVTQTAVSLPNVQKNAVLKYEVISSWCSANNMGIVFQITNTYSFTTPKKNPFY